MIIMVMSRMNEGIQMGDINLGRLNTASTRSEQVIIYGIYSQFGFN